MRVAIGAPFVSWVALGWGEPCVPWWGRPGFVGRAWWGGWGGPRVVNNVVVNRTTVVNVRNITVYRNVGVQNAVVAVRPDRFGRGPVGDARIRQVDTRRLEPVRGAVDLRPDRASFAAASGRGVRPPESVLARPTVATRAPVTRALPHEAEGRGPAPRIVPAPHAGEPGAASARPPFGESRLERARPPQAPRFDTNRRPDATSPATPPTARRQDGGPDAARGRGPASPRTEAPRGAEVPRGPEPSRAPQARRPGGSPARAAGPDATAAAAAGPAAIGDPARDPAARPRSGGGRAAPGARCGAGPASGRSWRARGEPRPAAPTPRAETPRQASPRALPGEPANRLYPGGRVERPSSRGPETRPQAHPRPAPEHNAGRKGGAAREAR